MAFPSHHHGPGRETLDPFLEANDLAACQPMSEDDWGKLRKRAFLDLIRGFCTWKNLIRHRGFFVAEIIGFGWAGIYRSLRVPSIAGTSFRNEGHFRSRDRISGTERFFAGAFRYPRRTRTLSQIIDEVNLRHHAVGVVRRRQDSFEVHPHFEAAFTYVATAFIEGIRNGYAACGLDPKSPKGRRIAADLCAIVYRVAGMVGLTRMPKDLAAHERFRDAYEAHLGKLHRSHWMETQAREIATRIVAYTAVRSGVSMEEHLQRHLDRTTADYLFPDLSVLEEVQPLFDDFQKRLVAQRTGYLRTLLGQVFLKASPEAKSDGLDLLWDAYRRAPCDSIIARIIGAILLHALEVTPQNAPWLVPIDLHLEPGETLFRQGESHCHCYLVLEASGPLVVTQRGIPGEDPTAEIEISRNEAPTMMGEIGLWRGRPALATVTCRQPTDLRVLRFGEQDFAALKAHSGFWHATAAQVQSRLRYSMTRLQQGLEHQAARTQDRDFDALLQLIRYIDGDLEVPLDQIPGIHHGTSLAECIDILRHRASEMQDRHLGEPTLRLLLEHLLDVIG